MSASWRWQHGMGQPGLGGRLSSHSYSLHCYIGSGTLAFGSLT